MTEPYVTDEEWLTRKVASISWNMKEPSYAGQLEPHQRTMPKPFVHVNAPGQRPCFVNRLPAELLMKVFCYLPWDRDCLATNKLPWNWVDITRVCTLWRDTVYLSAEYWTRVPLQTVHTVARALQVSGGMPLRLFADFKIPWKTTDALAFALSSLPRITELSITGTTVLSCDWYYVVRCLSARPATNLQRLTIHFADNDGYGEFPGYTIFNCSPAPALQVLELRGFALPWVDECSMFLVPSLTSLTLSNCDLQRHWSTIEDEEDGVEPGTETIFDALCNLPLLQVLVIDDCRLPVDLDSDDEFSPPKKPLTFPHLRKLTLHGNVRMVTRLLDNMVVPPSTSLNLWYYHVRDVAVHDPVIDMAKAVSFFTRQFNAAAANGAFYSHTDMMYDSGADSRSDDPLRRVTFEYRDPKQTGATPLPEQTTIKHLWTKQLDYFTREYWDFAKPFHKTIPCDTASAFIHITQLGTFRSLRMFMAQDNWYHGVLGMSQVKRLRLTKNAINLCILPLRSTQKLPALNSLELEGCRLTDHEQELEELLHQRPALNIYITDCTGVEGTRFRLEDSFKDRVHWDRFGSIQA